MKNSFFSFIVGLIFATGLGISGMTQPSKIIGFLDIFGDWDATLAFVMVGAIAVHFFAYKIIRKRQTPIFSIKWHVPSRKDITPALVIGAFVFGIGWGLGGYCPGPAMVSVVSLELRPFVFVISMFAGMFLFRLFDRKLNFKK